MFLSVIVPAYNEQKRIVSTLFDMDEYLKKQSYDYQILVVDDGSTDNTVTTVQNLMPKIAHVTLLLNSKNHGKGYVVRQGLLEATGDWRLFADADNSTPIHQIEKLLAYTQTHQVVIASRALKESVINPAQPFLRRMLGKVLKFVIHVAAGIWEVKDTQCGFKLFSATAAENILPKCHSNGWVFDAEILNIAKSLGYQIKEVPVAWKNNPESKVTLKSGGAILRDLLRIRINIITGKYR